MLKNWLGRRQPQEKTEERVEEVVVEEQEASGLEKQSGILARFARGLAKTRAGLSQRISQVFAGRTTIDESLYEDLEAVLIQADVGLPTTMRLIEAIRQRVKREKPSDPAEIQKYLVDEIKRFLVEKAEPLTAPQKDQITTYMFVGVNGAGKTTTIGKVAHRFRQQGHQVLLAAGDTFRAAAIEQLEVWADRAGVPIISQREGSDPAAVAFDAVQAGKARQVEALIIDTAGRLQTKSNLMQELAKVYRVVTRELEKEVDEVLLVLDATTGQNALSQAKLFSQAVPVTGVVLTKLDGTAKGGIVLAIAADLGLPVKLVGLGESMEDLRDFDAEAFASALFEPL